MEQTALESPIEVLILRFGRLWGPATFYIVEHAHVRTRVGREHARAADAIVAAPWSLGPRAAALMFWIFRLDAVGMIVTWTTISGVCSSLRTRCPVGASLGGRLRVVVAVRRLVALV